MDSGNDSTCLKRKEDEPTNLPETLKEPVLSPDARDSIGKSPMPDHVTHIRMSDNYETLLVQLLRDQNERHRSTQKLIKTISALIATIFTPPLLIAFSEAITRLLSHLWK